MQKLNFHKQKAFALLGVAWLLFLVQVAAAQGEDEDPEGESSGWEFVPGLAADAAAGLVDESFIDYVPTEVSGEAGFNVRGIFVDHVDVRLLPLVFRILDPWSRPIQDLEPDDLEVDIGGTAVPVAAVDWYSSYETPEVGSWLKRSDEDWSKAAEPTEGPSADGDEVPVAEPRHVVIFMQIGEFASVGLEWSLLWGHLKVLPGLERLLRGLGPHDRVALVSQGSHLLLWHDFTTDHRAINELLFKSVGMGRSLVPPEPAETPSLVRSLRASDLRDAATTAQSMRLLSEAMADIPGVKDVIYVGWSFAGPHDDLQRALRVFAQSQTVVSVLVSAQTPVPRGGGLVALARYTGGTIDGTAEFPSRSVDRLTRSLSGHYVVSLDISAMEDLRGKVVLRVKGREAKIVSRPYVF